MTKSSTASTSTTSTTQHYVYLSWTASVSSIIGYNIYRSTSSSGPFTRLNYFCEPATVYTDYAVVAGQTYYYAVTSVASGVESAYSAPVRAVVPSP
jgi:fibronectin type 3 domain-containing protein